MSDDDKFTLPDELEFQRYMRRDRIKMVLVLAASVAYVCLLYFIL